MVTGLGTTEPCGFKPAAKEVTATQSSQNSPMCQLASAAAPAARVISVQSVTQRARARNSKMLGAPNLARSTLGPWPVGLRPGTVTSAERPHPGTPGATGKKATLELPGETATSLIVRAGTEIAFTACHDVDGIGALHNFQKFPQFVHVLFDCHFYRRLPVV